MVAKEFLILTYFLASVFAGNHDIYTGYTVHGVILRKQADAELLHELELTLDADVWQHGSPGLEDALVMISPDQQDSFLQTLNNRGVQHYMHIKNVVESLERDEQQRNAWRSGRSGRAGVYDDYPRYDEIDDYMEQIAAQYPNLVTLVNAGLSFEGRPIKYLKISTTNFMDTSKPVYFMDAMIHAREWVTTPVALYSIHRLVEDLQQEDQDLLNDIDWIIMPLVNPDGYEYTHTDARLWRKTRSVIQGVDTDCLGVDGNRNFDVAFNTTGVSTNPCAITYPGPSPFSEPETGYVRDILMEYLDRIQLYMNIHSYGNWMLYGYGDRTLPPNAPHLHFVGAAMGAEMDAHKLPVAPFYRVGNSAMLLYGTSGSAQDYAQIIGVPFSYTLELPGLGYNFEVPPQYINQINAETWHGIAVTARLARSYYQARIQNTNA